MNHTGESDEEAQDRAKLHEYADEMDGYQLRLAVSFLEELFDLRGQNEEP